MDELLVLCKLVRMSVFGAKVDIPIGVNWPRVFADAGVNGVSAICYEAVKLLPSDRRPDFDLLLRWDLSAQWIREGFRCRNKRTQELHSLLESAGMEMLLLKGVTFADNYPQPELRECGDVDFVGLPDFEACNAFLESQGVNLRMSHKRHASFLYRGVFFENHTLDPTGGYDRVHRRTIDLISEALPKAHRRQDACLELDPVTQAVFLLKHIVQHVCYCGGRIALRMILDLALLLRRHPEVQSQWEDVLRKVDLLKFSELMLCASDCLLSTGFRPEWSEREVRRAWRFIRLCLTDSNRAVRYFAKFCFLPLRLREVLRLWVERAGRVFGRSAETS